MSGRLRIIIGLMKWVWERRFIFFYVESESIYIYYSYDYIMVGEEGDGGYLYV